MNAARQFALSLVVALPTLAAAQTKQIVFLAGTKDHGIPGRHEYEKDLRSLAAAPQLITVQHDGKHDVYTVMNAVDTRVVMFGPDVGELMSGGADPLPIIRDFLPVIRHAHLKDYDGGSSHDGYCALGKGRVKLADVVTELERSTANVALMEDLNPATGADGGSPLETARDSKAYLKSLGYTFAR